MRLGDGIIYKRLQLDSNQHTRILITHRLAICCLTILGLYRHSGRRRTWTSRARRQLIYSQHRYQLRVIHPYIFLVIPVGLEPDISGLKGRRTDHLFDGTIFRVRKRTRTSTGIIPTASLVQLLYQFGYTHRHKNSAYAMNISGSYLYFIHLLFHCITIDPLLRSDS